MKKRIVLLLVLLTVFSALCGCGKESGESTEDPITEVALGMTLQEAMEVEPTLSDKEGKGYICSRSFADEEGTLLISFNSMEGEPKVISILWDARPTDGNGKAAYDALFSTLKKIYGRPYTSRDKKDVEGVTGVCDEAQAQWKEDEYTVSVTYIEYHESGMCQILYRKQINMDLGF